MENQAKKKFARGNDLHLRCFFFPYLANMI